MRERIERRAPALWVRLPRSSLLRLATRATSALRPTQQRIMAMLPCASTFDTIAVRGPGGSEKQFGFQLVFSTGPRLDRTGRALEVGAMARFAVSPCRTGRLPLSAGPRRDDWCCRLQRTGRALTVGATDGVRAEAPQAAGGYAELKVDDLTPGVDRSQFAGRVDLWRTLESEGQMQ